MDKTIVFLLASLVFADAGEYRERFLEQYNKIVSPTNGYFSKEGVPYHTRETLVIESTDYGHEADSEAFR